MIGIWWQAWLWDVRGLRRTDMTTLDGGVKSTLHSWDVWLEGRIIFLTCQFVSSVLVPHFGLVVAHAVSLEPVTSIMHTGYPIAALVNMQCGSQCTGGSMGRAMSMQEWRVCSSIIMETNYWYFAGWSVFACKDEKQSQALIVKCLLFYKRCFDDSSVLISEESVWEGLSLQ